MSLPKNHASLNPVSLPILAGAWILAALDVAAIATIFGGPIVGQNLRSIPLVEDYAPVVGLVLSAPSILLPIWTAAQFRNSTQFRPLIVPVVIVIAYAVFVIWYLTTIIVRGI